MISNHVFPEGSAIETKGNNSSRFYRPPWLTRHPPQRYRTCLLLFMGIDVFEKPTDLCPVCKDLLGCGITSFWWENRPTLLSSSGKAKSS